MLLALGDGVDFPEWTALPSHPFEHCVLKTVCQTNEEVRCKFYMICDIERGQVWRITMRNAMSPANHFLV